MATRGFPDLRFRSREIDPENPLLKKDVMALQPKELVKWMNRQTIHKLNSQDEEILKKQNITGFIFINHATTKSLLAAGLSIGSAFLMDDLRKKLLGGNNGKFGENQFRSLC